MDIYGVANGKCNYTLATLVRGEFHHPCSGN